MRDRGGGWGIGGWGIGGWGGGGMVWEHAPAHRADVAVQDHWH